MSTDLATYQGNAIAQQQDQMQTRAVERLGDWARSAAAAYDVAVGLVDTSFVPQQFRGKPQEATAAILSGAEVGLSPMASLKSFDIIQGTAAPRALTLRAIVQSQGHEMIMDESTASRCVMRGKRRGSSEWVKVNWTMDRAKALGVTGKDNWKKQPGAMLVARATGELARLIAADAILGIGYTIEELTDGVSDDAPATVEAKPATRTMQRKVEPEPDEPTDVTDTEVIMDEPHNEPAPDPEPTDPPLTPKQQKLIHVLVKELDLTREQKLAGFTRYAGREITSSNDLTAVEAGKCIDALSTAKAERLAQAELGATETSE